MVIEIRTVVVDMMVDMVNVVIRGNLVLIRYSIIINLNPSDEKKSFEKLINEFECSICFDLHLIVFLAVDDEWLI